MIRKIGKRMGKDLYVHKDYISQTDIPKDVYDNAQKILKDKHPSHEYTIVKHNKDDNSISFLHSPDWNDSHEPYIKDSVKVHANGNTSYNKPKSDPQIYHQKWQFVGDDYKGFDVERSKLRTKQYQAAIDRYKQKTGDMNVSKRIGNKSFWEREIVPDITESVYKSFKTFISEIYK